MKEWDSNQGKSKEYLRYQQREVPRRQIGRALLDRWEQRSPKGLTPRENTETNIEVIGPVENFTESYLQVWEALAIGTKTTKQMEKKGNY